MKISFLGAAREVTGSKHLITTEYGKNILLDCGMYQGKGLETDSLNKTLGFDPSEIDHIILTHAHIDHSGLIPYMYRLGFRGSVVCTNATRDLCAYMLADAGYIQEHDTKTFNKKRALQGKEPVEPLFTKDDAIKCMELFIGIAYDRKFNIDNRTQLKFTNTGHMLGSGVANITITENDEPKRIAYTGDIGRPSNRILRSPDAFPQADILITESTYGNRLHTGWVQAEELLLEIVNDTCVNKGGKLIIPSFSVGRTQEIVYTLNNLFNDNRLPRIDIFVDSPLATNVTEVFRMHPECFNGGILDVMDTDPDPFGFNSLYYVRSHEESKSLNKYSKPCVIISASGMMEAGRVKHHLANNISNPNNTVLAVGYCAPTTLGARILRGDKEVSIHGNKYIVRAEIKKIDSYSGHGDYEEMIGFLNCQDKDKLQQIFIVHGEYEAQDFYRNELEKKGYKNISIPAVGEEVEI
ncbi:MAG: MBL fold metallo-hydrolase [Bacteroidales bacterium]|nr:MBL fold metallo-hydrolase [Bacteroidales bacterium]